MKWFKDFDSSGAPVSLNIRGNDQYKTGLGAIVTLITNAILVAWLVIRLEKWANRSDPEFFPYTEI